MKRQTTLTRHVLFMTKLTVERVITLSTPLPPHLYETAKPRDVTVNVDPFVCKTKR